jgi:hypothetical protein
MGSVVLRIFSLYASFIFWEKEMDIRPNQIKTIKMAFFMDFGEINASNTKVFQHPGKLNNSFSKVKVIVKGGELSL